MSGGGTEGEVGEAPLTHITTTRFIKQEFTNCIIQTSQKLRSWVKNAKLMKTCSVLNEIEIWDD
jgi:hypothetical protein